MKSLRLWAALGLLVVLIAAGIYKFRTGQQKELQSGAKSHVPTVAIFNLLSHPILDASVSGIKAELTDEGYSGAKVNVREVNANGEMDKLDAFARELLAIRPDVIVPVATPTAQAVVKAAPTEQNIVFSTVTNPEDVGISKHPANLTGVSDAVNYEANVDLMLELFPDAKNVGIIYNPGERNSEFGMSKVRELAGKHKLNLRIVAVANGSEVEAAARSLLRQVDVFYVGSDNTVVGALPALLKVAQEGRKPVIASDSGSVEQGALAAVSVDYEKLGRSVGRLVAEILRSNKRAGQIPNIVFVGDALVLNQKAASALSYTFPPSVVKRAVRTY